MYLSTMTISVIKTAIHILCSFFNSFHSFPFTGTEHSKWLKLKLKERLGQQSLILYWH